VRAARGNAKNLATVLNGTPGSEEQGPFGPVRHRHQRLVRGRLQNISFTVFEPWESADLPADGTQKTKDRGDIGDGENIFYTKPIKITGVAGLNDVQGKAWSTASAPPATTRPTSAPTRGRVCSTPAWPTPAAPTRCSPATSPSTPSGATATASSARSPTRAWPCARGSSRTWAGSRSPSLRGLGARAPYFHNGSAKTLTDVLNFYNRRFNIGFTADEIRKVVRFLEQT
jgi:hypothetical protein